MPRPKNPDPSVPIPVRIPTSMLERLQAEAATSGASLAVHVRRLLSVPLAVREFEAAQRAFNETVATSSDALSTFAAKARVDERRRIAQHTRRAADGTLYTDKTERVDLRNKSLRCTCDKPTISKVVPVCTTCRLPR